MSVKRWVWPSWRHMSMPTNSARLIVWEGGVEVTRILMRVSEAGWVAVWHICEVCAGDCVFHGAAPAFMVAFWVGDVGAVP
jgi:hypothetical protein